MSQPRASNLTLLQRMSFRAFLLLAAIEALIIGKPREAVKIMFTDPEDSK